MRFAMKWTAVLGMTLACALGVQAAPAARAAGDAQAPASAADAARMLRIADEHRRLAERIAQEGGPRELALAAWLEQVADDGESAAAARSPTADTRAAAWLKAADAGAAGDVLTNNLIAAAAAVAHDANLRQAAARRWEAAEPDNLAPRFIAGDTPAMILAGVSANSRFDLHWLDQVRWIAQTLARYPDLLDSRDRAAGAAAGLSAEDEANGFAVAITSAFTLPAFGPVVDACRGKELVAAPSRRGSCLLLGQRLRDASDIVLGQMVGSAIVRAAGNDPATARENERKRRRIGWLQQQDAALAGNTPSGQMAQLRARLRNTTITSEIQAMEHDLSAAHIPLDPPAGWQAPGPQPAAQH